jgi:hypothetical protein
VSYLASGKPMAYFRKNLGLYQGGVCKEKLLGYFRENPWPSVYIRETQGVSVIFN